MLLRCLLVPLGVALVVAAALSSILFTPAIAVERTVVVFGALVAFGGAIFALIRGVIIAPITRASTLILLRDQREFQ